MKKLFLGLLLVLNVQMHGMDEWQHPLAAYADSCNSFDDRMPELLCEKVLFAPKDDISHAMQEMIVFESCHINIMMYNFTDSKIVDALVDARRRGVMVTLIVDISSAQYPSALHALQEVGARMLVYNPHEAAERETALILKNRDRGVWPLMHNKSWLFFRNYERKPMVVTGSYNATLAVGTYRNEENVMLSTERDVFDKYRDSFYELSKHCTDLAEFRY